MKSLTKLAALCLAGAVVFASAGCANTGKPGTESSDTSVSETESETTASETTAESTETTGEVPAAHKVEVTDQSVTVLKDEAGTEYKMIVPKLIVDGKEADAINAALNEHITKNHPLKKVDYMDGDTQRWHMDGETTSYAWGTKGNIVSIVIHYSETFTDGFGYDVFNYNVDTLQPAGNEEVLKVFGLTEDELFKKLADTFRAYWDSETYLKNATNDLDKSIAAISSSTVTPFVMPDGNLGATGHIFMSDSQFFEMVRCFDLDKSEIAKI